MEQTLIPKTYTVPEQDQTRSRLQTRLFDRLTEPTSVFFDKRPFLVDEFSMKVGQILGRFAAQLRKAAGKDPQIFGRPLRPLGSARTFKLFNYQARHGFQLGKG